MISNEKYFEELRKIHESNLRLKSELSSRPPLYAKLGHFHFILKFDKNEKIFFYQRDSLKIDIKYCKRTKRWMTDTENKNFHEVIIVESSFKEWFQASEEV